MLGTGLINGGQFAAASRCSDLSKMSISLPLPIFPPGWAFASRFYLSFSPLFPFHFRGVDRIAIRVPSIGE
jgi:hypothetical protein